MHKGIILGSFVVLVSVLVYLTYVTFRFTDQAFQSTEKTIIKDHYAQSIRNDKLFPGGQAILDRYIAENIHVMEQRYLNDTSAFKRFRTELVDSLFMKLREESAMDSLFAQIREVYELSEDLDYLLTIQSIKLTFQQPHYISLFESEQPLTPWQDSLTTEYGFSVSGDLRRPLPQNLITSYLVSTPADYSYRTTFSLYVDHKNRHFFVLKRMLPTLILGLFSIACVVSVYYVTYRKWIRQKRLAEMKSDFLNSITHEFNTPLSTIIVANKNLQHASITSEPSNMLTLTQIIDRQANRLKKLFDQVMDVTTMDSTTLSKEPVDINLLINDIVMDYRLKADEQGGELTLVLPPDPVVVDLNRFFVTTMVLNLFDNAIKYNLSAEKTLIVSVATTPSDVQVRIMDNGIGIPDHEKEHIFDKFYRLQGQGTQQLSGLGLGLYYVYQCIKIHGWFLTVNSQMGTGSQFIIHIPR